MRELDPVKVRMAQGLAKLFMTQVTASQVPVDVRFMAVELTIRALLDADVKEPKRLQFFDQWTDAIRSGITGRKPHGKEGHHRRGNRRARAQKAT